MPDCPHASIRFCPLYVAAHDGEISTLGCIAVDDEFYCEVARGRWDYTAAVDRLYKRAPELVQACRRDEAHREAREQRQRNLRLNGIHD